MGKSVLGSLWMVSGSKNKAALVYLPPESIGLHGRRNTASRSIRNLSAANWPRSDAFLSIFLNFKLLFSIYTDKRSKFFQKIILFHLCLSLPFNSINFNMEEKYWVKHKIVTDYNSILNGSGKNDWSKTYNRAEKGYCVFKVKLNNYITRLFYFLQFTKSLWNCRWVHLYLRELKILYKRYSPVACVSFCDIIFLL